MRRAWRWVEGKGSQTRRNLSLVVMGLTVGAGTTLLVSQTNLMSSTSAIAGSAKAYHRLTLFADAFEKVRTTYVEKLDEAELIEWAINGMLADLDPHSSYMDPKRLREMEVQTRGEFSGIGLEVTMEQGLVRVITAIDDTPAARAGILTNDIITHIQGEEVQGLTVNQATEKILGPVNTSVMLKIQRKERKEPLELTLTRARFRPVHARVEGGDIGHLRISVFNDQTFEALRSAIHRMTNEIGADKLKGFVIDLRNNPGGVLDQAILVSDAFLESGEIVSIRGRNAMAPERFNAKRGDLTKGKHLVMLINGGSASGSEIVAAALQDHKRAVVLGTRSFGKGSVQTSIPLRNNGAVHLTTARYYTPSGRSIEAKGIKPDFEIPQEVPDDLEVKEWTRSMVPPHLRAGDQDEIYGASTYVPLDPATDKQLNAALEFLRQSDHGAYGTSTRSCFDKIVLLAGQKEPVKRQVGRCG